MNKLTISTNSTGSSTSKNSPIDDKINKETMNVLDGLKHQVIENLKTNDFPDFKFLFSDKVLEITPALLDDFLQQEKQEFENTLKIQNNQINFGTFEDFSLLEAFWDYLNHYKSVSDNESIRKIIEDFEPKIMDFSNEVAYSKRYFEMYEHCLANCDLDNEQKKIISDTIRNYKIKGINLDTDKQEELKGINKALSELSSKFSNNALDSENEFEYHIESDTYIKELPEDILEGAKKRAGDKGGYVFSSSMSEYIAIMKYCTNSEIRKEFYKKNTRFASDGPYDNRGVILEILQLKKQKAQLLGYKNHAECSLEFKMADTPEQVIKLIQDVAERARKKAEAEFEVLRQYFNLDKIEDWDTGYYMRKYKQEHYDLDDKVLKPYFEYNNVLEGLHNIVEKLYGIQMKKTNIKSYHDDVIVYEVYKDEKLISYYFLDAFFRPEKRSGAWANNIRTTFKGSTPIMLNVCNFTPLDKHGISLLTKREVETIFHEFGHGIHEMSSKSKYAELSGFGVEWDFVEVPSQFMEHWTETQESLDIFAKHHTTGKNIPSDIIENMNKSEKMGNGIQVLSQCSYALVDMLLHSDSEIKSISQLDKKVLDIVNHYSINQKSPEYKMYASFSHIFAGGYSAGYYSYMWAEMLELDIWREFQKNGIFDKKTAKNYFDNLLSAGSGLPASEIFKNTMGREVDLQGFFEYKGI